MAKKLSTPDFTNEEINREINARARALSATQIDDMLNSNVVIRHPMSRVRVPANIDPDEPSMTHQAHRESCDINNIIRQFDRTGVLPPPTRAARYEDVSELNADLTSHLVRAEAAYQAVVEKQAAIKKLQEKQKQQAETVVDGGIQSREITPSTPSPKQDANPPPPPIATQS